MTTPAPRRRVPRIVYLAYGGFAVVLALVLGVNLFVSGSPHTAVECCIGAGPPGATSTASGLPAETPTPSVTVGPGTPAPTPAPTDTPDVIGTAVAATVSAQNTATAQAQPPSSGSGEQSGTNSSDGSTTSGSTNGTDNPLNLPGPVLGVLFAFSTLSGIASLAKFVLDSFGSVLRVVRPKR